MAFFDDFNIGDTVGGIASGARTGGTIGAGLAAAFGGESSPPSELAAKDVSFDPTDTLYFRKQQKLSFFYVASGTSKPLVVSFKAFLTAFDDQYTSKWTPNSVYGRMDPIATFENTTRRLNVSFGVPSYDNKEAKGNFDKLSRLITMLYPVYQEQSGGSASQIVGAPLLRMKFGNLITKASFGPLPDVVTGGLLGYLDGINFTPNFEAGFHDKGASGTLIPMEFSLNCSFNVLHEHGLGFKLSGTSIERRKQNFPYGTAVVGDFGTTRPPDLATGTKECEAADYVTGLGLTTDATCQNSAVVTPEGSFRDSEVGQMFGVAKAFQTF